MMVYELCREAEKRWRRLTGSQLLTRVLETTPHEYSVEIKRQATYFSFLNPMPRCSLDPTFDSISPTSARPRMPCPPV